MLGRVLEEASGDLSSVPSSALSGCVIKASPFPSLSLSFPTCKMETIILPHPILI